MEMTLLSIFIYMLFIGITLFILVRVSTIVAALVLILVPLMSVLLLPATSLQFYSYEHILLFEGLVQITNFHILFFVWAALLSVIVYTEFITWYLKQQMVSSSKNEYEPPEN